MPGYESVRRVFDGKSVAALFSSVVNERCAGNYYRYRARRNFERTVSVALYDVVTVYSAVAVFVNDFDGKLGLFPTSVMHG